MTAEERMGRSPHGERGLKFEQIKKTPIEMRGRSPHGERGLKSDLGGAPEMLETVALLTESVD